MKNRYILNFEYNSDLFFDETISCWTGQYLNLIRHVLEFPNKKLESYSLVSNLEKKKFRNIFNQERRIKREDQTNIVLEFKKEAKLNPQKIAIEDNRQALKYKELDRISSVFALDINQRNFGYQSIGLVLTSHNVSSVVGMLSVLKQGDIFIPIDENNPIERIKKIILDSKCDYILTNSNNIKKLKKIKKTKLFLISRII